MKRVLVTGAGGFVGWHLVRYLKAKGYWVRGVDIKYPEFAPTDADEFVIADLRRYDSALEVSIGVERVYALAAQMGGMGWIGTREVDVFEDNNLIMANSLRAAHKAGCERLFFSSSVCIYNQNNLAIEDTIPMSEPTAFPAYPDLAYGWSKLASELGCQYHNDSGLLKTRVARFHNCYGTHGTWQGGREKAPAALSRKIAYAKLTGQDSIDVWGDGNQTRVFVYIDDLIEGVERIMNSDYARPINLGTDEVVTINDLARMIMQIAGVDLRIEHDLTKPQGVRGRKHDGALCRETLGWHPSTKLAGGLKTTYVWIEQQVKELIANSFVNGRPATERVERV